MYKLSYYKTANPKQSDICAITAFDSGTKSGSHQSSVLADRLDCPHNYGTSEQLTVTYIDIWNLGAEVPCWGTGWAAIT